LHVFTQDASFLSALNQEPLVNFIFCSVIMLNKRWHISYQLSNTGVFRAARVLEQTRKHKVARDSSSFLH
jgi:hypothetical protein